MPQIWIIVMPTLKNTSPQYVIDYFTLNWENITYEWVKGLQIHFTQFLPIH